MAFSLVSFMPHSYSFSEQLTNVLENMALSVFAQRSDAAQVVLLALSVITTATR